MTNPSPTFISPEIWNFWLSCKDIIKGVRLGGIYAAKRGYHNTRKANPSYDYSVTLADDKAGPADKAAAVDLTMSDANMRVFTKRLRDSALNKQDNRLRALREFIGTLDSKRVYCRISHSGGLGNARGIDDWSRDSTHLWHIHLSLHRKFINDKLALQAVLSVLSGETYQAWINRKAGGIIMLPRKGDGEANGMSESVEVIQRMLVALGHDTIPKGGNTSHRYDGEYGAGTEAAVNSFRNEISPGISQTTRVTPWTYYMMVRKLANLDQQTAKLPSKLVVSGGTLELKGG